MQTQLSVSSPHGCFVCVSLLCNPHPPGRRWQHWFYVTISLFILGSYTIKRQLRSRQRHKGETRKREVKGRAFHRGPVVGVHKHVSLTPSTWVYELFPVQTALFASHSSSCRETCNVHRKPDTSNVYARSYLPTENNRTNVCSWTPGWVTILNWLRSRCSTEFLLKCCLLKRPLSCLNRRTGVVEMRSGPRTAPPPAGRARASGQLSSREWKKYLKLG